MSVTDELLENDTASVATFGGELPLPPAKHVAVVGCTDARLDVYRILGLQEGRRTSSGTPAASSPTTRSAP